MDKIVIYDSKHFVFINGLYRLAIHQGNQLLKNLCVKYFSYFTVCVFDAIINVVIIKVYCIVKFDVIIKVVAIVKFQVEVFIKVEIIVQVEVIIKVSMVYTILYS